MFRSRAFLDLAHEMQTCTIKIPDVCAGYAEGLEPVHLDFQWLGRGLGHKSSDVFAAGCHACGAAMHTGQLSREDKQYYSMRGAILTMEFLLANGWLTIAKNRTAEHR